MSTFKIVPDDSKKIIPLPLPEINFSVELEEIQVPIDGGTTSYPTERDLVYEETTGATVRYDGQIIATQEGEDNFDTPEFISSLKIKGGNALISELENGTNSFFMIQNTNLFNEIGIDIKTSESTKIILKNGSIIPAKLIKEEFKLSPGDMVLFMS